VGSGNDEFGRQAMPKAIDTPPYHGIFTVGCITGTQAGIEVDGSLRVVREDGRAFENLFGAGEFLGAGAVMGNGKAGGQAVGQALTFGMLAGRNAARLAHA
jgi:succinate dehydrogenase/fumarate reductase flavoprotein subunit